MKQQTTRSGEWHPSARFTHKNEAFRCENCGKKVPPSSSSCRNHCPFCLHSKHLDVFPGDRAATCLGLMRPIAYEMRRGMNLYLQLECLQCGYRNFNRALLEDTNQADDYEKILLINGKK